MYSTLKYESYSPPHPSDLAASNACARAFALALALALALHVCLTLGAAATTLEAVRSRFKGVTPEHTTPPALLLHRPSIRSSHLPPLRLTVPSASVSSSLCLSRPQIRSSSYHSRTGPPLRHSRTGRFGCRWRLSWRILVVVAAEGSPTWTLLG